MAMAEMAPSQQKIGKPASPFAPQQQQQQQMQQNQVQLQMQPPQNQQQQNQQQMQVQQSQLTQQQQQQQFLKQKLKEKKMFGAGQGNAIPPPAAAAAAAVAVAAGGVVVPGSKGKPDAVEVEMARQDLTRVCNPEIHRPFSSLEDACERLLPYHVVAEYEMEEIEERVSDAQNLAGTGVSLSRAQQWNDTLSSKSRDYFLALQKQMAVYNLMVRKRWEGDMRGEERLLVEQFFLEDEKHKLMELRSQIDAEKEAAEAKMKEAIAHREAQARAEAAQAQQQQQQQQQAKGDVNLNDKARVDGQQDVNMFWASDAEEEGDGEGENEDGEGDEEEGEEGEEGDGDGEEGAEDDEEGDDGEDGEGEEEDSEEDEEENGMKRGWSRRGAQFDLNTRTR